MNRYKNCRIRLNKELVKRYVYFHYGSIKEYCEKNNISRVRFWEIVNRPHLTKNGECLQKLAKNLHVSIETILL